MNEKKAREIIEKEKQENPNNARVLRLDYMMDLATAYGYIEAVKKAKVLEDVIRMYLRPHNAKEVKCGSCHANMRKALTQWEAEK